VFVTRTLFVRNLGAAQSNNSILDAILIDAAEPFSVKGFIIPVLLAAGFFSSTNSREKPPSDSVRALKRRPGGSGERENKANA
jgi:hypothetical protein